MTISWHWRCCSSTWRAMVKTFVEAENKRGATFRLRSMKPPSASQAPRSLKHCAQSLNDWETT
jgi:hypothetical protein